MLDHHPFDSIEAMGMTFIRNQLGLRAHSMRHSYFNGFVKWVSVPEICAVAD